MERWHFWILVALAVACATPTTPATPTPAITVAMARIGCLDVQVEGNMTRFVAEACDGRMSCSYKAPTQDQYKQMGVKAETRPFCSQGMEINYSCGPNDFRREVIKGDAWDHPPAQLFCIPR